LKKKKKAKKILSFDSDEDDTEASTPAAKTSTSKSKSKPASDSTATDSSTPAPAPAKKPNPSLSTAPKAITKASLAADAIERDRLKRQFLALTETVKQQEIIIPFVFWDGAQNGGGTVRMKKGDAIWLILERGRKVGAEMGGGGDDGAAGYAGKMGSGRRAWARVGVDDLLLVRGSTIVPHHLEVYYFIVNKIPDPSVKSGSWGGGERRLFGYKGVEEMDVAKEGGQVESKENGGLETSGEGKEYNPLSRPGEAKTEKKTDDASAEGAGDDPTYTKIVDRRWYEKNKHIFPASTWREYRVGEEGSKGGTRGDGEGNRFFFG
jgi:protein FAM50